MADKRAENGRKVVLILLHDMTCGDMTYGDIIS